MLQNVILTKQRMKIKCSITSAEKFYAFATIMSLMWQFCIVVYDIVLKSPLSTFVTIADILIWGIAWLNLTLQKNQAMKQIKNVLPAIIFLVILAIKLLIANNFSDDYFAPSRSLYQIYSLIYALLWGMAIQLLPTYLKNKIIYWFYLMLIVTVIPSYFYVFQNADALRDGGFYGHVDFQYIYAVIPLIGLTVIALLRGNVNKKMRVVMTFMVISNAGIVLISNFATAMVLMCLSIFLGLIFTKKMRFVYVVFTLVFIGILAILLRQPLAEIVTAIGNSSIFGDVMKRRLYDISKLLKGDGVGWSFTARIILMEGSWHSFLQNPILGISFDYSGRNVLGFHETWITLLGYGGIVGFVFVVITLINYYRYQNKCIKNTYFMNAYFSILLVVIILSFLNPIITKSNLMITVGIMPILSIYFAPRKKESRFGK